MDFATIIQDIIKLFTDVQASGLLNALTSGSANRGA